MLVFQSIDKSFGPTAVLREVSFKVERGQTVGLVGENGAGKSTLMNILGGNFPPDGGAMYLDARPYQPRHPKEAAHRGIAFIHQELNLFPNLSIAENLYLTAFPRWGNLPVIRHRRMRRQAKDLLEQVGLTLPPETLVERLSPGERQLVEIAKALAREARLIILDEPTTSLSARETGLLFTLIGRLRARSIAMIYISHTLEDVLRLCDQVVVLRDGAVVELGAARDMTMNGLIAAMVGRSLTQMFPSRTTTPGKEVVFQADGITQAGIVHEVSLRIHRSELVGVFGLMGAGRTELARILFGLDPAVHGTIAVNGSRVSGRSCRRRIHAGLAFLTEDRREEGLCLEASIADNIALVAGRRFARGPFGRLDLARLCDAIAAIRRAVRLSPAARDDHPVRTLSGGNQQKVVLAKWLLSRPKVLILDEPTRGIDVGAKFEVYQLIHDLVAGGAGVLLISSEIEELIGMCDRILVMRHGEIRDEVSREQMDRERLLRSALHEGTAS